jgi:hypothetical protein
MKLRRARTRGRRQTNTLLQRPIVEQRHADSSRTDRTASSQLPSSYHRGYGCGMVYREGILCAYCDGVEAHRCPRCECRLCEAHRPQTEEGWCWACAKELKDELDIVHFKTVIGAPMERRYDGSEVPMSLWVTVASWVASARQRRARKRVIERSREQVEAWRREDRNWDTTSSEDDARV